MSGRLHVDVAARLGDFDLEVAFEAEAQGVTAIFGPSGAGKSTLLRAIAGLERKARGTVRLGDVLWQDRAHGRVVPPHRRRLGYVFQQGALFEHLSVRHNLLYGYKRTPPSARRLGFDDAVEWAGLAHLVDRRVPELSGGERNRVALARALLCAPALLLLDEPLAALDWGARAELLGYLERLPRELEVPVLYVSHAIDEVARLADAMLLLDRGRVQAFGPVQELLTRLDLPLARELHAAAAIEATLVERDAAYGLAWAEFAGGRLCVSDGGLEVGRRVRLQIQARDVSLSREAPGKTSILNHLHVRLVERRDEGASQCLVKLDAGGTPLLARLTRKSADELGLTPGLELYAQVKSVALMR